jgi:NDP-sugar pyrophosphorylase family protein
MNVDILTDLDLRDMISYHQKYFPIATLATSFRQTSRNLLFDGNNNLCGWRNIQTGEVKLNLKPLEGNEVQKAFNGLHIINPKIFSLIKLTGKFSMIEVYLSTMSEWEVKSFDHTNSKFIDVGKPESICEAEKLFPLQP